MDGFWLAKGHWTVLHAGRNRTKADVHAVGLDGERYAVKDYRRCLLPIRVTLGRWSLAHEERAYQALQGVPGIPAFFGRQLRYLLVTEYVDAVPLALWNRRYPLPAGFFSRLKVLLQQVHARGVVHGDLHHQDVLIGDQGKVWLVDFSTSLYSARKGLRRGWLWRQMAALDRYAVLRLQERYEPGTLNPAENLELRQEPRSHRWSRRVSRWVRDLRQPRPRPPVAPSEEPGVGH